MSYLILARHGETEINVRNKTRKIYYGRQESPLTEKGRFQAMQLGMDIARRKELSVDLVVSSRLERTRETARIAIGQFMDTPPVFFSDGLTARSLGIFEGKSREELERDFPDYVHDPGFNKFDGHFIQRAPGGENLQDVTERACAAMEQAERMSAGNILLVTHATVVRCLLGNLLGLRHEDIPRLKIPNAAPVYLERTLSGHALAFASLQCEVIPNEGERLVLFDPSRLSA